MPNEVGKVKGSNRNQDTNGQMKANVGNSKISGIDVDKALNVFFAKGEAEDQLGGENSPIKANLSDDSGGSTDPHNNPGEMPP